MRRVAFWLSLLFVFTIPWERAFELPSLGSASRVSGLLMALAWLAGVATAAHVRSPGFFHLGLCVFVALNAASLVWTTSPEATLTQVITWLELLVLSFIFWDLYTTRAAVTAALQAYILGAYMTAGSALNNYFSGSSFYRDRFSAAGTHPDDLGVVLALGIPAAAYLAAFGPRRCVTLLRVINCAYIPVAFIGISLSGTRTAMVAAAPGVLFGLAVLVRSRRVVFGGAVVLMAVMTLVVPQIPEASLDRLATTGTELQSGDLNGRIELWKQGLASFRDLPLLGRGSNTFRSINVENKVAHNSFLSVLVELGITGLLLFAIIVFSAARRILGQPTWEKRLWLAVFSTWVLGASMLTWEYRKPTWLFLNLVVASAAVLRASATETVSLRTEYGPMEPVQQFASDATGPA